MAAGDRPSSARSDSPSARSRPSSRRRRAQDPAARQGDRSLRVCSVAIAPHPRLAAHTRARPVRAARLARSTRAGPSVSSTVPRPRRAQALQTRRDDDGRRRAPDGIPPSRPRPPRPRSRPRPAAPPCSPPRLTSPTARSAPASSSPRRSVTGAILGLVLCTSPPSSSFTLRACARETRTTPPATKNSCAKPSAPPGGSTPHLIVYIFGSCVAYTIIADSSTPSPPPPARARADDSTSRTSSSSPASSCPPLSLSAARRASARVHAHDRRLAHRPPSSSRRRALSRREDDDETVAADRCGQDPADGTTVAGRTVDLWRRRGDLVLALPVFVSRSSATFRSCPSTPSSATKAEKKGKGGGGGRAGSDPSGGRRFPAQSWHSTRQEEEISVVASTHSRVLDVAPAGGLDAAASGRGRPRGGASSTMERVLTASTPRASRGTPRGRVRLPLAPGGGVQHAQIVRSE